VGIKSATWFTALVTSDLFDDDELDEWIAEEEEGDRHAARLLREALAGARGAPAPPELGDTAEGVREGLSGGGYPFDWVRAAAGFGETYPVEHAQLIIGAVAATISPREETGLGAEEESLLLTLERADWLGAIAELVRAGPGAPARPGDLVAAIHRCPEIEVAPDVDPDDDALTEAGFSIVSPAWLALGVLDDRDRLTPLGAWALPRALARAWGSEFDEG
jgi:hypothetical protein